MKGWPDRPKDNPVAESSKALLFPRPSILSASETGDTFDSRFWIKLEKTKARFSNIDLYESIFKPDLNF
jgi:hypothetical protein